MHLRQLLLLELKHIEAVVSAALCKQLKVVALLDDLAVGENDYLIRVLDRGQTVCNDKHRTYRLDPLKRVLDKELGLGIDICSSLVKDDDRGLVNDGSGK